jgi:5-methylcytosine-specific restriction endonuclease McrA
VVDVTNIARPSRNCAHPGCRTTVIPGNARCQLHTAQQQAEGLQRLHTSQTSEQRTLKYGKGWKAQRLRIIRRDGGCAYCGSQGGDHPLEVHHLTNSTRPADRELVCLCRRHHRALEAEIKRGLVGKVGTRIAQWMEGQ